MPRDFLHDFLFQKWRNEFKDNNEKSCTDPEIGFLAKLISRPNGCATAMPTAWELNCNLR